MKKVKILGVLVLFMLTILLVLPGNGKNEPINNDGKGKIKAPEFTLEKYGGGKLSLSDYKGKVILLNFWATWCPPCRHELPDIARLREELKDKGFEVIGIILERNNPNVVHKVEQLKREFGLNYPLVWGTNKIVMDYGNISSIPQSFIIDKQGNIVKAFIGARPYSVFKKEIIPLLK